MQEDTLLQKLIAGHPDVFAQWKLSNNLSVPIPGISPLVFRYCFPGSRDTVAGKLACIDNTKNKLENILTSAVRYGEDQVSLPKSVIITDKDGESQTLKSSLKPYDNHFSVKETENFYLVGLKPRSNSGKIHDVDNIELTEEFDGFEESEFNFNNSLLNTDLNTLFSTSDNKTYNEEKSKYILKINLSDISDGGSDTSVGFESSDTDSQEFHGFDKSEINNNNTLLNLDLNALCSNYHSPDIKSSNILALSAFPPDPPGEPSKRPPHPGVPQLPGLPSKPSCGPRTGFPVQEQPGIQSLPLGGPSSENSEPLTGPSERPPGPPGGPAVPPLGPPGGPAVPPLGPPGPPFWPPGPPFWPPGGPTPGPQGGPPPPPFWPPGGSPSGPPGRPPPGPPGGPPGPPPGPPGGPPQQPPEPPGGPPGFPLQGPPGPLIGPQLPPLLFPDPDIITDNRNMFDRARVINKLNIFFSK